MAASVTIDPAWTLDNQNTSFNGRQVIGSIFQQAPAQTGSHILWRNGVIAKHQNAGFWTDLWVIDPVSGMNVRVNQGSAIITRTGQGPYLCPNSTVRVVPLDASDVTNPRIDLIVLQVTDTAIGDGSSLAVLRSVTGVAAGVPVAPATPTGAIVLAQVRVEAGSTTVPFAKITDVRKSTAIAGAVRNLLPGDLVTDLGTTDGELRWTLAGGVETFDTAASLWRPLGARGIIGGRAITGTNNLGGAISVSAQPSNMNTGVLALPANRRFKIHCRYKFSATDTTSNFLLQIMEDTVATGTTGTQIREFVAHTLGDDETRDIWAEYETTAAVSRAFKLVVARISGAATLQFKGGGAGSTSVVGLWVEDIGPNAKLTVTAS